MALRDLMTVVKFLLKFPAKTAANIMQEWIDKQGLTTNPNSSFKLGKQLSTLILNFNINFLFSSNLLAPLNLAKTRY